MINRKYLPSKKFLISLSIAIVIIIIAISLNYWKPNTVKYDNAGIVASANASSSFNLSEIDSDGDGLPDWKEALYGTDPHKADTDGDGTPDGEEIALGRDPLKANTAPKGQTPNDFVDAGVIAQNQQAMEDYEKLSDTDKLSRDLVSNIFASQPASGVMDQNTVDSIVSTAVQEIPKKQFDGVTKITDLTLLETDSTNLSKNLGSYTASYYAETEKLRPILGTEINFITTFVTDNGTSSKSAILKTAGEYQSIVDDLIKMPVPVAIGYYDVNFHLAVINGLEKIIAIDKDVVNSNGIGILVDLANYNVAMQNLISTLSQIDSVLKIQR